MIIIIIYNSITIITNSVELHMKRLLLFIYLLSGSVFADVTLIPDTLSTKGVIYLNATESANHGEKYLLNQEFSSAQWGIDWTPTNTTKIHSLFIYNRTPTPIYPTLYFEELYGEFKKLLMDI